MVTKERNLFFPFACAPVPGGGRAPGSCWRLSLCCEWVLAEAGRAGRGAGSRGSSGSPALVDPQTYTGLAASAPLSSEAAGLLT